MHTGEILKEITRRLAGESETPALDAQVLAAHVLGRPRAWLLAHPDAELDDEQRARLEAELRRLEAGEPLPYVLGHWEFYGLDFRLTPAVLIPRPETELLVERALAWLGDRPAGQWAADVGTGSGCIAVALAVHHPGLQVVASDISSAALHVTRINARRQEVIGQVHVVQADLLPAAGRRFDLIAANLPYIPSRTLAGLKVSRWEPRLALDGGPHGLELVGRLLGQAAAGLAPGGLALLEIEAGQGAAALALARQAFPAARTSILPDLSGRDRLLEIQT